MIELGVFLPVLSNGWIASTTAPRYRPTYAMNKAMTPKMAGPVPRTRELCHVLGDWFTAVVGVPVGPWTGRCVRSGW